MNIIVKFDVLNSSFMELKPVEFYAFLKVIHKPYLNHAVFVACSQKLPSVHVNCWTKSPSCDFLILWQLNTLVFAWKYKLLGVDKKQCLRVVLFQLMNKYLLNGLNPNDAFERIIFMVNLPIVLLFLLFIFFPFVLMIRSTLLIETTRNDVLA